MMHPADQLVATMNRIYRGGMTTTSGANLSVLDSSGDIWITPGGVDKGVLCRSDIIKILPDGTIEGIHKPSVETHFHQAAYKVRPDIHAVLHAHSPALVAFSIMHQLPDSSLIPNTNIVCGRVSLAPYAMMGTIELGEVLAKEFMDGSKVVIMENHGVTVAAESMGQAYKIFETIEFAARTELLAMRLGKARQLSIDQIDIARTSAHTRLSEFSIRQHSSKELDLRREITSLLHRGLDQNMFYSSQGTISARVDDGTFLITPYGFDRREIFEEDLVMVKKGLKEKGKIPSRAVFLHELIYHRNPMIQAIVAAQPPHLMSFSITETKFDTHLLPEPYLLLRELPRAPYALNYNQPQKTASMFREGVSSIMLENDGVITTGNNLTQAFDRLEVAEFTARAVLATTGLAEIYPLTDERLTAIDNI
jgi:L-fuculose-phosphate aldolase